MSSQMPHTQTDLIPKMRQINKCSRRELINVFWRMIRSYKLDQTVKPKIKTFSRVLFQQLQESVNNYARYEKYMKHKKSFNNFLYAQLNHAILDLQYTSTRFQVNVDWECKPLAENESFVEKYWEGLDDFVQFVQKTSIPIYFGQRYSDDGMGPAIYLKTKPIKIAEVYFGAMLIGIYKSEARYLMPEINIIPIEPNYNYLNYYHPHVSPDGHLCAGDGYHALYSACQRFDLMSIYELCTEILTYCSDEPYIGIESWSGVICQMCNVIVGEDQLVICDNCDLALCENCMYICENCEQFFCAECLDGDKNRAICKDCKEEEAEDE